MVVETRWQINDHPVVVLAEHLGHFAEVGRRHEVRALRGRRSEEHSDAGRMVDDDRLEDVTVGLATFDGVEHRAVLRVEVEEHAHVAELQVGVDQRDPLVRLPLEGEGEVGGNRRPTRTALRREDGDDLVVLGVLLAMTHLGDSGVAGGLELLASR